MSEDKENNQLIVYESDDGLVSFDVPVDTDTVWLTQKQMAELFDKNRRTITEHIGNIFKEGELDEESVCRNFRHTASDGKRYRAKYYNLDVIISVGYRVKSKRGTQFRQWATKQLKDVLLNGYAYNLKKIEAVEKRLRELSEQQKSDQKVNQDKFLEIAGVIASLYSGLDRR